MNSFSFKKMRPIALVLLVMFLIVMSIAYVQFFKGNIKKDAIIYIPTGSTYSQVIDSLKPHVKDLSSFDFIAHRKQYPDLVKSGKYKLEVGESNISIVNKLRAGLQEEQTVKISSFWSVYDMASNVSKLLEIDSLSIIQTLDTLAKAQGFKETDACKIYFLPETYNFYWNTSAEAFVKKMKKMHDDFWTEKRKEKAKNINLTPLKATILASIVQRETIKSDEQPIVAGLYLNRLKKGMRLEADPTLVYLRQKNNNYDATIKRVYNKDKKLPSAYNTYTHVGLPPLPICMPYRGAIDAVLNPQQHEYVFMCAQPKRTGYHNFAKTYSEHKKNAKLYQDWADSEGIK